MPTTKNLHEKKMKTFVNENEIIAKKYEKELVLKKNLKRLCHLFDIFNMQQHSIVMTQIFEERNYCVISNLI